VSARSDSPRWMKSFAPQTVWAAGGTASGQPSQQSMN